MDCGVKYGQYELGQPIYVGFGDAGSTKDRVVPCLYYGTITDDSQVCC